MAIVWIILIGFVIGAVAKFFVPGRDGGGFVLTAGLGIAGSIVASYLGQALGMYHAGSGAGFIGAVIGSILLLVAFRAVRG